MDWVAWQGWHRTSLLTVGLEISYVAHRNGRCAVQSGSKSVQPAIQALQQWWYGQRRASAKVRLERLLVGRFHELMKCFTSNKTCIAQGGSGDKFGGNSRSVHRPTSMHLDNIACLFEKLWAHETRHETRVLISVSCPHVAYLDDLLTGSQRQTNWTLQDRRCRCK